MWIGTHLIDIRLRASSVRHDRLDEPGNFSHDINPIKPILQRALQHRLDGLTILSLTAPLILDRSRLRPVVIRVTLRSNMSRLTRRIRQDNLSIPHNSADIHNRRAVRRRGGILHHDRRELVAMEIDEVPSPRRVMRLHALQSVHEHSLARKVNRPIIRHDRALNLVPRPEHMSHLAPRILQVRSKQRRSILAGLEARGGLRKCEVDDGALVRHRLDRVHLPILRQLDRQVLSVVVHHVIAEINVAERVGGPERRLGGAGIEDLGVKLARSSDPTRRTRIVSKRVRDYHNRYTGAYLRNIAVNNLHKRQVSAIRRQVENLGLHARRVHIHPFEIVALELRERHRRGLLGDGADGGGAIDGLLGAGHVGQPVW